MTGLEDALRHAGGDESAALVHSPKDQADPDNPTWTAEDFAKARPGSEVLPPEVLDAFRKRRPDGKA